MDHRQLMARPFYTLFFLLLLPIIFLRMLWRSRLAPAYRKRWLERLGIFASRPKPEGLWMHSVSVGETIAIAPLVKRIQHRYPDLPITITTTTPTGSDQVEAQFGDSVFHVYAPYDIPGFLGNFLRRIQPKMCIIMETELWPNTVAQCAGNGIPVLVANARLSERSAKGYGKFSALTAPMLKELSLVAVQNKVDGDRFCALGLPKDRLQVTGSIKFDLQIPADLIERAVKMRANWGATARPVVIAASTHEGEDQLVLQAFSKLQQNVKNPLLVLVPRHPERFDKVAEMCTSSQFTLARRSRDEAVDENTQILLGDTMGELLLFYGVSDAAFVGGSLVSVGGHNPLEPAALNVPIFTGPHYFNFQDIVDQLASVGGAALVSTPSELAEGWCRVLQQTSVRDAMQAAAAEIVIRNRGSLDRLEQLVVAQWLLLSGNN